MNSIVSIKCSINRNMEELYAHMVEWQKFLRKHDDNIFNALFKDKENFSCCEIVEFANDTAFFFDVPCPHVYDKCETLAKEISRNGIDYDIFYNKQLLEDVGINNKDAFKLMLTHEICHHVFRDVVFGLLVNEMWTKELVCDYFAAVRSIMAHYDTGKYKYAINNFIASYTHPPGWARKKIFLHGRDIIMKSNMDNKVLKVHDIIDEFKNFIIINKDVLDKEWYMILSLKDSFQTKPANISVCDIPDNNLIKQYILYGKTELS